MKKDYQDLLQLMESDTISETSPYTWDEGKEFLESEDFKIARALKVVSDRPPIDWGTTLFDTCNTCFLMSIALCCALQMGALMTSSSALRVLCFLGGTGLGVAAAKEITIYREKE